MTELPKQEHRHGRGLRAHPLVAQRRRVGVRHRPVRSAARDRLEPRRPPLRPRRDDRRGDAAHRRARARDDDARRRRGPALERGAGLRAAAHHPPRDPRGAPAGSEGALAAALVDATDREDGRGLPGPRQGPRPDRRGPRARGGRLRAHAAHGADPARGGARRGRGVGVERVPRRRRLQTARHPRVPDRAHRRDRRRVGPRASDRERFDQAMAEQRGGRAPAPRRSASPTTRSTATSSSATGSTEFVGRDVARYSIETTVLAVLAGEDGVSELFLDATPFYAESGGQVGDTGCRDTETGRFEVADTQSVAGGLVRAPRPCRRRGPAGPERARRDRPGAARGHATQPHRDPPAARRSSPGPRRPRAPAGFLRRAGPLAIRLLARRRTARRGGR